MSKQKAYRTESQPVERAWYFEHSDGLRFEHLATIEKLNADGSATLSFQRRGEIKREIHTNVKPVSADNTGSGWTHAKN